MSKHSFSYLFPPEQINELPSWRFRYHFKKPFLFAGGKNKEACCKLKDLELNVLRFSKLDNMLPESDIAKGYVVLAGEVSESDRQTADALERYESDVWKMSFTMLDCKFGEMLYEAVDFDCEED